MMTAANVGFVGLGAMGLPMARQLAMKLSDAGHLYVFDIAEALVKEISEEYPAKVTGCHSAREVAEKSVS